MGDVPMNKPLCETTDCQCPFLGQCNLVRDIHTKIPELIARIQNNYCTKSAHSRCGRFQIYQTLGHDAVPPLMLPDQTDWARQIIREGGFDFKKDTSPAGVE